VITAVYVTPGSEVSVGEELLKLEAMKMNNSILSNRAGVIRDVCITVGQVVKNNEILLEFAS
jgi:biotin carboxyl carrier protein